MPHHVKTEDGTYYRFAVLIPSRSRSDVLRKSLSRMPFLDNCDTWFGIQRDQWKYGYSWLAEPHTGTRQVVFENPDGSVGIARDALRRAVLGNGDLGHGVYDYVVMTDDNARFSETSLHNLVRATAECERIEKHPVFMAGMHGTAPHFDRNNIAKSKHQVAGLTLYRAVGAIFHCVNAEWMTHYQYPPACFALEDRHLFMTAIRRGETDFRICMDAPFTKTRYQEGGQGDIHKRMWNCGRSIEQLAHDFPEYVGAKGTFPTPWQFIISMAGGATADRLVGGAMRKGDRIAQSTPTASTQPSKKLTARIRRSQ